MMKKFILIFLPFVLSLGCINDNHETNLKEKEQSLEEYECYFFFIADCPASRNNLLKMNEINKKYSRLGLNIIGVVSDPYYRHGLLSQYTKRVEPKSQLCNRLNT
jgi:hypothetical protein